MKFDHLLQKGWSVTELNKEGPGTSESTDDQTPSEYNMSRRFVNALKPEIATKVIRHSYNLENSNLNAIFEAAKFIEEAHFYETWEECNWQKHAAFKNSENSSSKTSGYKPLSFQDLSKRQMDSKVPEKGAYNKTHNNNSKPID
ncbi:hypothetical protein APHAL10511_002350 [Amanita phalloides]|nr:hypothetical protein APHAL10511_002350 [Amanita phalloides]